MTKLFGPAHGSYKHGETNSIEYRTWCGMKQRCLNPKSKAYPFYGGRGITIDPAWMDFRQFLADMGRRPPPKPNGQTYSIERVDNNKGYSADNCIWATRARQLFNKRGRSNRYPVSVYDVEL
jgi:hypothetical protein